MKKRKKGTVLQRIMTLLFSVALITGIVVGTVSTKVFAADTISGTDWEIDGSGVLTIESDAGMTDWAANRGNYDSQVKQAVIKYGVTSIPENAFYACNNLTEVTIPDTVKSIGASAFNSCGLKSITIPSSVKTIGRGAFNANKFTSITIPDSVSVIPDNMCTNCRYLTSVILPASITEIEDYAFSMCSALETVTMKGTNPPTIGAGVFDDTYGKCKFVNDKTQGIEVPYGYVETYRDKWSELAEYIRAESEIAPGTGWALDENGELTIENDDGMTNWATDRSGYASQVNKAIIKSGVTSILEKAFYQCNNLTEVTIPNTVKSIGNYAFYECGLTSVTIPDTVESIGECAFNSCKLTSVTLPASITNIGNNAFCNCNALETVTMKRTEPPTLGNAVFNDTYFVGKDIQGIEVPADYVDTYKEKWSKWQAFIRAESEIASGTGWVLDENGVLTIDNDDGMTNWAADRSSYNLQVKQAVIKSGVTSILEKAFWLCNNLTEVTIPNTVKSIGAKAFESCGLTSITIPSSVETIGAAAFNGNDFTSITLPDRVSVIPNNMCINCSKLTSVTLPASITKIEYSAFSNCSALETVTMKGTNPPTIDAGVFDDRCKFMKDKTQGIEVPDGYADTYKEAEKWSELAAYIKPDSHNHKGTLVSGQAATCTADGWKDYYKCPYLNGKYYEDEDCKTVIPNLETWKTGTGKLEKGHTYAEPVFIWDGYKSAKAEFVCERDETHKEVLNCTVNSEITKDPTSATGGEKTYTATVKFGGKTYSDKKTEKIPHTHALSPVKEIDATCTEAGNSAYYTCSGCDKWFADAEGKTEIKDKTSVVIPAGHTYNKKIWKYGSTKHWYECSCGAKTAEAAHSFGAWTVTKKATESETGLQQRSCSICKYKQTEVIPKIPKKPSKAEQTKNELSLNAKLKVSQPGKVIKVSWGRVSGADGYDVYVQYCGSKMTKKNITNIKNGRTTKVTVKKINGKSIDLKKDYKVYVVSYKLVNGKKITLGKTITAHLVGRKNVKYTNVKAVKVQKSSYSLKKGRTAQIKAKTVLVSPKKKQLSNAHARELRYKTTNKKVASVSSKGKIKAVGKGTCYVYVYARNGYAKRIKVTVK